MPDNQNARGRYTPREGAPKDKTTLVPQCLKYHKAHPEEYRLINDCKYFNCGKKGHFARDCKSVPAKVVEPAPQGRPNARVYSLNKRVVETGPFTLVSGQLPISNLSLYALIDSGATHSFIAK